MCKNWINVSVLLGPLGSAGPGRLARLPAVTSGLSWRLEPVARTSRLWPGSLSAAFASRPGLGRGPGSAARDAPTGFMSSPPRKVRRPPSSWFLPQALPGSACWVGSRREGGCPGSLATCLPRVNHLGREPELSLFPYNKPVAWWGNLHVSQVTAAGLGQKCPHSGGTTSPRGSGPGQEGGLGGDPRLECEVSGE